MSVDLSGMSRAELQQLAVDVENQLKLTALEEKKAAIEAARLAVQERGFEFEDLFGPGALPAKAKAGKSLNPPKYRNPENPEQTWSGRGRRPAWIAEAEKAGMTLQDMAI